MPRRIALLASLTLMAGAAFSSAAEAGPADDACGASPTAVPCVFAEKAVESERAACRSNGGPEELCAAVPYGHDVSTAALAAHQSSWLHRTAEFQLELGNSVPLRDAQWVGTHNSFNANANGMTLSHSDSNQQLTLAQQFDADVRSIELDLHFFRGEVRVCHARPASEQHAGCTNEPTFAETLPEIVSWIAAHDDQVLLLYLEDALGTDGYAPALAALETALGSRIYKPAAAPAGAACTQLPLQLSRQDVLAAGKNIVVVGDCSSGWKSHVHGWKGNTSAEAGNSTGYTCASPISADKYETHLVRFFEDSTFVSSVTAPNQNMAARRAGALTPDKVAAMTACGVNLFGFDQYEPNDGRLAATIWSWAPGQPDASAGACTIQRADDGRWYSAPCDDTRIQAPAPRTAQENAALRALAGGQDVQLTLP